MTKNKTSYFWSKVNKRGPDDCWEWLGRPWDGYGIAVFKYIVIGAHRLSYELNVGTIPDGLFVCHKCDNRICVNPAHLFIGTKADNFRDMFNKNRHAKPAGEKNGRARLTRQDVVKIFKAFKNGEKTTVEMSEEFCMSTSAIKKIVSGRSWRHLNLSQGSA